VSLFRLEEIFFFVFVDWAVPITSLTSLLFVGLAEKELEMIRSLITATIVAFASCMLWYALSTESFPAFQQKCANAETSILCAGWIVSFSDHLSLTVDKTGAFFGHPSSLRQMYLRSVSGVGIPVSLEVGHSKSRRGFFLYFFYFTEQSQPQ
jgi:hypothetical protein